jgi:hypothetical protein
MNSRLLALTCLTALAVAGCGGGSADSTGASSPKPVAKPAPPIAGVIAVAQKNAGFAGCKEVAPGAVQPGTAPGDPRTVQALLCDGQQVANYWVWDSDAAATSKTRREDRPSFVDGKIVVTTGEALLVKQFDAAKAKTLPAEIEAACGCGAVVTP